MLIVQKHLQAITKALTGKEVAPIGVLLDKINKLQADLAAAKEELETAYDVCAEKIVKLKEQVADWEELEASLCPEDVGFKELIVSLKEQVAGKDKLLSRADKALNSLIPQAESSSPEFDMLQLDIQSALPEQKGQKDDNNK